MITIDKLSEFCLDEDAMSRYDLKAPFVLDGIRYATDGAIAVAMPAPGEPDSQGKFPGIIRSLITAPDDVEWNPWATTPRHHAFTCDCDSGTVACECCGHRRECEWCGGTSHPYICVGDRVIRRKYDDLIRSLGDAWFALPEDESRIHLRSRQHSLKGILITVEKDRL